MMRRSSVFLAAAMSGQTGSAAISASDPASFRPTDLTSWATGIR